MDFDELRHLENDEDFISIETLMNEFDCLTQDNHQPVSYTHLTLPTIYSV